jgi:hypothetical protein
VDCLLAEELRKEFDAETDQDRRIWLAEQIGIANAKYAPAPVGQPIGEPLAEDWLMGSPMDPLATPADPLPALAGFPFLTAGVGAVIVGPTGGGRSSLIQACAYDGARAGLRVLYMGHEVTEEEFNARSAKYVDLRGDVIGDELLNDLARVRYVDLGGVIATAWERPDEWAEGIAARYDVVAIDPLSAVESALGLNFEQSNRDYIGFYDRLVQPVVKRGVTVIAADNVGHAIEAKGRAKGASAKQDRADVTFACSLVAAPPGLLIRARKVRSARSPIRRDDEWIFHRDTQLVERRETGTADAGVAFRPTTLMERVSEALEQGSLSKSAIRRHVKGRNEYIDQAILCLEREDYLTHDQAGYTLVKPFTDDDPAPDPAQSQQTTLPTLPHAAPDPAHRPAGNPAHAAFNKGSGAGSPGDDLQDRAEELEARHRGGGS